MLTASCGTSPSSGFKDGADASNGDAGLDGASDDGDPGLVTSDAGPKDTSLDGKPSAPNLVPNGDFEQGNVLFGSDYAYATNNTVEGEYTVGTSGQSFNGSLVSAGDHTSGKSKMFIGNGKSTPDRVWFSSNAVNVAPNTQYYFEAWVMNLCCATGLGDGINPVGPSVLSFYANGQLLGTRTSTKLGAWEGLTTTWNSGAATTVTLKLVNANTDALGNDFAVDDIYLGTETSIPPPK
jgi:hypothetical protein